MFLGPPRASPEQEHLAKERPVHHRADDNQDGPSDNEDRCPPPLIASEECAGEAEGPQAGEQLPGNVDLRALAPPALSQGPGAFRAHRIVDQEASDQSGYHAQYYRYVLQPHSAAPVSFET